MNYPNAMTQVRQANPVPDPTDLPAAAWSDAELLHVIDERTAHMRELMNDPELDKAKQQRHRWRMPVLAAVGAFVVVLGAVGIAAFVGGEPEPEPADELTATTLTTPAAPTTLQETTQPPVTSPSDDPTSEQMALVNRLVEAFNTADAETLRSVVAPGVGREGNDRLTANTWTQSLDGVIEWAEFDAQLSSATRVASCRQFSEIRVSCRFLTESAVTDTLGSGPFIEQTTLQIEDGMITRWQADIVFYPFDMFSTFMDWVKETHPDIRYDVSDEAGFEFNNAIDPDLALQLLDEYAAFLDGE